MCSSYRCERARPSEKSLSDGFSFINDLLPGRCPGFPVGGMRTSEQSGALWSFLFALPFDVAFDLLFVEPHGGRKVPDAPDAVFVEVDLANEFEFGSEMFARLFLELPDGI